MNRSFQSIVALLVSLSGAMLAVTWIPGKAPRPAPHGISDRKRAAAVPCGFIASESRWAFQSPDIAGRTSIQATECRPSAPPIAAAFDLAALDLGRLLDLTAAAETASAILPLQALKSVGSALGTGLAPLWPHGAATDDAFTRDERGRIEAEYAQAELAAAAPAGGWLGPAWRRTSATLAAGAASATDGSEWSEMYAVISEKVVDTYDRVISGCGLRETLPSLLIHFRRQHERLALREALLREMDRRFLKLPIDREHPSLPPKPQFRSPSRKLMLAAADALKSLSESLRVAADRLAEASRTDVAELHSPSENR